MLMMGRGLRSTPCTAHDPGSRRESLSSPMVSSLGQRCRRKMTAYRESRGEHMTVRLRFVRQQHEADNIQTFCFEPEVALGFQAGQYLRYTLPHAHPDTRGVARTFTIASAPSEALLRLT